jgi:hypothetical protein
MENIETLYESKLKTFKAYHKLNPEVWERFERNANAMVDRGRKHYSHDTIIAVIRFERDLQTTGCIFKIANESKAFYGRMWMMKYGEKLPRFFHLRQMMGESNRAFKRYYQEVPGD